MLPCSIARNIALDGISPLFSSKRPPLGLSEGMGYFLELAS